ncbi:MAG TPA: AAA family ATPase, partial [Candidatus Eremiobacteraceae bacterium]|nr:AAA family ATPase [Candidatus Eremiobacteraceae bacterium]
MAELDIRLFGHPQFLAGGSAIRLPNRSVTIPLAAYLLLNRADAISRSALAFTLWADAPEARALAELRRYVYLLNKALPPRPNGEPWIAATDDLVHWNGDSSMRLDVAEFERASKTSADFGAAAALYTGDLLEDLYDDWVVTHRERLRDTYLGVLAALIARHREERDFRTAAEYANRLLVADPWREDVVRLLMACRYELGDGAGALAAFDSFARRLRSDLGAEPMPETLAAREAIVRNAPLPSSLVNAGRERGADVRVATSIADVLPFAGRDLEFEQLRAMWLRAAHGNGGCVLVGGQAGIGKSRLLAELANTVESEGGRTCIGTTTFVERQPYEGIVEALRYSLPFLASLDIDGLRASIIAQLVPELAGWRDGLGDVPPVDPSRQRSRLLDAVATCLSAMARARPLLVILEDLHWAGGDSAAALAFLARRLSKSAVLIAGTFREEEVGRSHPLRDVIAEMRADGIGQTISLRPLSLEAVRIIVERLPVADVDRGNVARLGYERSEGNPLFLTEALRAGPELWSVSDVLSSVIGARLATLSDSGRDVAELAAVAGHGFHVDLVRDVAGIDEHQVLDGLYELMDRHLVREAGARGRYDYVFTHHLIHDAIYAGIDPAIRARRHRRLAQILEGRSAQGAVVAAADLALHRERGGDTARAAESYVEAARDAARLFANDDAIRRATKAIDLAVDDRVRGQALLVREGAFGRLGRRDLQADDIKALSSLSAALGDEELAWETLRRKVYLTRALGDRAKHAKAVDDLEDHAAGSDDMRKRAEALLARADYLVLVTSHDQAEGPAIDALDLYEEIRDGRGQIEALALLAQIATVAGDFDGTRRYLSSLRKRAEGLADKSLLLRAISAATVTALQRHRIDDAAELAREGLSLARTIGDREEEAEMLQRVATVATFLADFDGARRTFADAAEALEAIGNVRGLSHALANEFVLSMRLGLLGDAARLGARVLALIERTDERRPLAVTKVNMSLLSLLAGDAGQAKRLALEALEIARAIKFPLFEGAALSNLGNAERALGDLRLGVRHLEEGLELRKGLLEATDILDDQCDLAIA